MNYTFICANNFYQNDLWFAQAIVNQGLYTQPIGHIGLSRVDVRDIAEASVTALLSDEWNGQSISLSGPDVLNGEETARILSEQFGYSVRYAGNDLESWSAQARQWLPGWMVDDWVEMYQFFQRQGFKASAEDIALLSKVLGRAPRSYADYLKDYAHVFQPKLEFA
ncbi:hypothetical protein [Spirosoma sp. KNUC1025]|uniref:hypothetical protein n=1 Tax=Spirosoma sp. KNUC1025 TaxID=2894082 RepID=UPI0038689F60